MCVPCSAIFSGVDVRDYKNGVTMPINLKLWEVNLILSALAKLPYEEVVGVIHRIKIQMEKS